MEERLSRLEKDLDMLKRKEREVYVLSQCEGGGNRFYNIGVYSRAEDVYETIKRELGYCRFTIEQMVNLLPPSALEQEDDFEGDMRIEKFLLK